ncbi:MAG TPA: hydantoinase B/oxoprolinase family protein [Rhodospirillales bacterium]|jgi:N-methylhydantoinase B|nr:hydantoinase B/oxoprolinase family protein [Rhodospirillales bacterium]HIM78224.1 hydantoinase B/oxoprolinase family protein [Rhodospirillales bacterium]
MKPQISNELDPIAVEVIRNKLEGIANEMQHSLLRSAFSPIVKEGLDASASLFTLGGETLAQSISIPIHLGTLIPIVGEILKRNPVETLAEGDIFIMNDPYLGGTHLPDIAIIMPVFVDGRLLGLSATMAHHQDVGGMTPGSVPTNATEIFQEGIRIPPLKLASAGKIDENLMQILRLNVRLPDLFMGDINAQIAACNVGRRRLRELCANYDHQFLSAVFKSLLDRSEVMTRDALGRIPAGEYHYTDYLDNDGIVIDERIRISVTVIVDNGEITFDFDQTSAQVKGPLNCVPSGSLSAACFAVRVLTGSDIPTNGGCFRPIHLKLPEGSIVNPREPAAVNARTSTIKRIAGCMVGAFQQVLPDKITADSASEMLILQFGGQHRDGRRFVVGELIASGSGAGIRSDGIDVIETDASNCMNLPVEALELEAPVRVRRFGLRRDSGGPGEYRGGLGVVREYEILDAEIKLTHRGERHYCAARGCHGGQEGARSFSTIIRASGSEEVIPSKRVTELTRNDRLIIETAGGGGYGPPSKRSRERVLADILDGKISRKAAVEIYGLDPGALANSE